ARLYQSVRIRTQERGAMRPCCFSKFNRCFFVRRKSASFAASLEQSTTKAGPMKFCAGIVSTEPLGRSLPETQCTGASKCVPVCSPQEKLFQYQAGPRSS